MSNPLDLPGPAFLQLYVVLLLGAFVLATALRYLLRQPSDRPSSHALSLSPYEVAYLQGGEQRAVDAAIARLVRENVLVAHGSSHKLSVAADVPPFDTSELHRVIHEAAKGTAGQLVGTVRSAALPQVERFRRRLQELGLVVADEQARLAVLVPLLVVLLVPTFGFVKVLVGLSRDRPVGFLIVGCILSVVIAIRLFARPVLRSQRGDYALIGLRERNAALETQARRRGDEMASDDVALAFGLFGAGVLAGGPLADLRSAMKRPASSSGSWSSSGCGSSCGGGGGCGGGGCGGCGGG